MEERRTDTDEKHDQNPGRDVSNQNAEEQPDPGGSSAHRRPGDGGDGDSDGDSDGTAGEGSQSTGHPDSAG